MCRPILFLGIIRWMASCRIRSGRRWKSFQATSSFWPPGWPRVPLVGLLLPLVAGEDDLVDVGDDDVVAGVDVGGVGRAVLAHQDRRDLRGEPADDHVGRVDHVPLLGQFPRLRLITLHGGIRLTLRNIPKLSVT